MLMFVFVHTDPSPPKTNEEFCGLEITLPSTVGVRRRNTDRGSRRRSERLRQPALLSEGDPFTVLGSIIPSPIHSDRKDLTENQQGAEAADLSDTEEIHHSTPEPAPAKKPKQPKGKQAQQQQPRSSEPASRKPERGRKPERAPLKKPWENPKPRARSKSRERAATRAKTAPPAQSNKHNTSIGMNDTFDFDFEEAVHITPFKAKAEDSQPATPKNEEAQTKAAPAVSEQSETNSSSPSSESEDSLYVPQKSRRRQISPDRTKGITTRKCRSSKVVKKKDVPPSQEFSGEYLCLSFTASALCFLSFSYFTNNNNQLLVQFSQMKSQISKWPSVKRMKLIFLTWLILPSLTSLRG